MNAEGVEAADMGAAAHAPKASVRTKRARTKKSAEADAQTAPDAVASEAGEVAEKPRRTTRKRTTRKKADAAAAAPAEDGAASAELSPEVAQARALAQVSQASVARRSRRAATKKVDAAEEAASDADTPASSAEIPAVDPALRPHRRGRKPKAYVEAEKAAAAALAAQQALALEVPAESASQDATPTEPTPAKAAEKDAETPAAAPKEDDARGKDAQGKEPKGKDSKGKDADAQGQNGHNQARRSHAQRGRDNGEHGKNGDRNDRRNNRQNNRKQRNNRYNVPTEPTLSRDELAGMKVAELREKARELDLDVTGKKKAELVEEVYQAAARAEGFRDITGILDISNDGFGHIRAHGYMPSRDDAFVPANLIRAARLRPGDMIEGTLRPSRANDKFPGLAKIKTVNGRDPEEIRNRPKFASLTPIYPNEPLKMEHGKDSITGRAIDIVAPVGKGQRGLIVSPPKAGKTTVLKKICQAIAANNPEVHLICLLVDERPEEVTDMERSIKGEVVASTFDMPADNHTRVAELVIERAKRLAELGGDVVVVLDSITRLARAYNLSAPASGRILSGGVDSAALYPPKRFLGAARNIENGGSLTILASALVDTGSKMDEVIFEEFKGTGNMELKLDRDLADRRIFPAIDPVASGTRNEDLLIDPTMLPFVQGIRRVLAGMNNTERCASAFIKGLKQTGSNREFLIRSAKRAAESDMF